MKSSGSLVRKMGELALAFALSVMLAAGCAPKKMTYQLPPGETVVAVEASSFAFKPNVIHARAGVGLLLKVQNVAGMEHNLTVEDPEGKKVVDVDLPAGQTIEIRLPSLKAGTYPFYCDKPLHASFGMKGEIVVGEP